MAKELAQRPEIADMEALRKEKDNLAEELAEGRRKIADQSLRSRH